MQRTLAEQPHPDGVSAAEPASAAPARHKDNELALLDEDSFMSFITSSPIAIDCTSLGWWCRLEQRQRYPRLSGMVIVNPDIVTTEGFSNTA